MATVSVANTSASISGDTLLTAENNTTVTGLITFDRDPSAPFAVTASSAVVTNLDADKVDGYNASQLAVLAENEAVTGTWSFADTVSITRGTASDLAITVDNTNNTAGIDASMLIRVGGSSAGDPYTVYSISGVNSWSHGIDNSDSDKYKICEASTLTSNDHFVIA